MQGQLNLMLHHFLIALVKLTSSAKLPVKADVLQSVQMERSDSAI